MVNLSNTVTPKAQFLADYLWNQQECNNPGDGETSHLYMFLDHNLDEALQAWEAHDEQTSHS